MTGRTRRSAPTVDRRDSGGRERIRRGLFRLTAHSIGILGKLYSELFESLDQRLAEAARARILDAPSVPACA